MADNPMTSGDQPVAAPGKCFGARLSGVILRAILTMIVVLGGIWAAAALALADMDGYSPRILPAILFAVALAGILLILRRPRYLARLVLAAALIVVVAIWYANISPSNDRAWAPNCAKLATATIEGDRVTLHNYRQLEPDSAGQMRETYVDQTYDLNQLVRADLIMSYWGPVRIAHALVSFEFSDGRCAAMSIEIRRRANKLDYNPLTSLFRNYELIYIVGNERALIGGGVLDDHHRLFLYRTNMSLRRARALFLRYANALNELSARPQWYNAISDNCTTCVYRHLRQIPPPPSFSMMILLNGKLPDYLYARGSVDTSIPLDELKRRSDIKEIGRQAYASPDFSRLIRAQLPTPPLMTE